MMSKPGAKVHTFTVRVPDDDVPGEIRSITIPAHRVQHVVTADREMLWFELDGEMCGCFDLKHVLGW